MGLAVGANELTKARFEYPLDPSERTEATGRVELEHGGAHQQFDLATVRVVAGAAGRAWGAPLIVREVWLFSTEADPQAAPDLELFFDFGGAQPPVEANARSSDVLVGRELAVLPVVPGSRTSRVRFPGAPTPWAVRAGTLLIKEAVPTAATPDGSSWRIEGELKLTVSGDDAAQSVNGQVHALLTWR
jgi:hypothetical protein